MDGVSFTGDPLDIYLQELDINEETVAAVEEPLTTTSSPSSSPAFAGLPGAFGRAPRPPSPAAKAGTSWWAGLCLGVLPVELVAVLSLSADARDDRNPAGTKPAGQSRADYRYLLVSSSLLEASLPRATERSSTTSLGLDADTAEDAAVTSSGGNGDSPASSRELSSSEPAARRRRLRAAGTALLVLSSMLLILVCGALLMSRLTWIAPTMTGLIFGGLLLIRSSTPLRRASPQARLSEASPDDRKARRVRASSSSSAPPPPVEAVNAIERLVDQAEAFDRACNSGLARVWDAERDRLASDVTPLLPLRRRLAETLSLLQHHVETAHANIHVLTSPQELFALSALYSLGTASKEPTADLDPASPSRTNRSPAQATPLRRARTITAGSSSFASPTGARRTPLSVERFVSPPPRPSLSHSSDSAVNDGELSPPPAPAQFTMMPPRTPRLGRHGRTTSGAAVVAAGEGPSFALRSWSPLVSSPPPQVIGSESRPHPRLGLLPSPSLPLDPAAARSMARSPSLDESEEDAIAGSSPWSTDLLRGVPHSPCLEQEPGKEIDRAYPAVDSELQSSLQSASKRSAKRRSLQNITYRHASSPVAQLTPRRSPADPTFPLTSPPASATGGLSRLRSLRPDRTSFSHTTSVRPVFGAHSPTAALQRPRHRTTLSLSSPSVPNLQAAAFEQRQAALASLKSSPAGDTSASGVFTATDAPTPLSHADLLTAFWALHARRRHILVALLALRRDMVLETWAEAAAFIGNLATAFEDAKNEVVRALHVASQDYGGGTADDSFAPPPLTKAEQRGVCLGQLWNGLQLLTSKVGSLEDIVDSGDGWEPSWLELRDDLGELIRVWERSRADMGVHVDGGSSSFLAQPHEVLGRPLAPADTTTDEAAAGVPDSSVTESTVTQADVEDDVSRYLRETANALPSVGREELFAAESSPGPSRRAPSKMTREERIRLAKKHREETQKAVAEAAAKKGPRGMTDVILELDGLMRILRRNKGAIESEEDEPGVEKETLAIDDCDKDASLDRPPLVQSLPATLPTLTGFCQLPPFELPLPRSSLPALSSQGSSDGDADLDDSYEFVSPRHRDSSQVTLRAVGSDEEDGLADLGRIMCDTAKA